MSNNLVATSSTSKDLVEHSLYENEKPYIDLSSVQSYPAEWRYFTCMCIGFKIIIFK